jgi:hypothetical protein
VSDDAPRRLRDEDRTSFAAQLVASAAEDGPDELSRARGRERLHAWLAAEPPSAPAPVVPLFGTRTDVLSSAVESPVPVVREIELGAEDLRESIRPPPSESTVRAGPASPSILPLAPPASGAPSAVPAKSAIDEVLSIGGPSGMRSPFVSPALTLSAPSASTAAPTRVNSTVVASVLGASVILVGGALGAVWLLRSGGGRVTPGVERAPTGLTATPGSTGPNAAVGSPSGGSLEAPDGSIPGVSPGHSPPSATAASSPRPDRPSRSGRSATPQRAGAGSGAGSGSVPLAGSNASAGSSGGASPAPAAAPVNACVTGCRGDIACLLACRSPRSDIRQASPSASSSGGNESPSRADVLAAMRGVSAGVRACAPGRTGTVTISIVFASSGRVTTAQVGPPLAGTPEGSCMARVVRAATVPGFSRPTFQVSYPFSL